MKRPNLIRQIVFWLGPKSLDAEYEPWIERIQANDGALRRSVLSSMMTIPTCLLFVTIAARVFLGWRKVAVLGVAGWLLAGGVVTLSVASRRGVERWRAMLDHGGFREAG